MKPKTKVPRMPHQVVKSVIRSMVPSEALISQKNRDSLTQQAQSFKQAVSAIRITTEVECQNARVLLTRIIAAKGKALNFIKPILDNAKEGLRLAKEQEEALVGPFKEAEQTARQTINNYLTAVMIAEREQKEEQERLKKEYEEKIARSKRPERIKPVEEIPTEELVVVPVMEATSIPMVPKYEITDESLVPDKYIMRVVDREKIWNAVRSAHKQKESLAIPGVRIWEEASLTIRR